MTNTKILISRATLESRCGDTALLEKARQLYETSAAHCTLLGENHFSFEVENGDEHCTGQLIIKSDGRDLKEFRCSCGSQILCEHACAAILSLQSGIVESPIVLGKSATLTTLVDATNTANAVKSGLLDVFATPMMIALMENAAADCLTDGMLAGETSVGTHVDIEHKAASPLGATITVTATITSVFGRKVNFAVNAHDNMREIGAGSHTRMIVDAERMMLKLKLPSALTT